jgi:acetyl-CoA synthetase
MAETLTAGVALPPDYGRVPERLNVADVCVTRQLRSGLGDLPAILDERGTVTFAELDALANRYGNALRRHGIGRGDYVLFRAPNSREYGAALLGALKLGAIVIPASTLFRGWELESILSGTGAKLMVTTDELLATVAEHVRGIRILLLEELDVSGDPEELKPEQMAPDEPAFVICTSGTTGPPKRVLHGHRWAIAGGHPCVYVAMQFVPGDVVIMPQEFSWLFVLGCAFLLPLSAGGAAGLYSGRFEPEKLVALVERYRANKLITVPTVLRMLVAIPDLEQRYDVSSLQYCWCGGEPLAEDTYREATRRFGIEIFELIGQTEVWLYMSNYPGVENKPGSLGRLLPGRRAAILDDDGREIRAAEHGHLVLAADDPGLALGYHGLEDEWQSRIKNGWFYTGDIAYRDDDGYYWYVGRADELIKSRGYRIAPGEVETATQEHPAVLESGVVGVPDQLLGNRVKAFIRLKPGWEPSDALAQEIIERVRTLIAPYKAPKEIEFVSEELPKTATGKIDHKTLRRR